MGQKLKCGVFYQVSWRKNAGGRTRTYEGTKPQDLLY